MIPLGQPDATLERFRREWGEAAGVSRVRTQGKILRAMIMYVLRRYKIEAFKDELVGMRNALERNLDSANTNDFIAASGAIAYAYNILKDSGRTFGGGLRRKPTAEELKAIRGLRRRVRLTPGGDGKADHLNFESRL